MDPDRKTLVFLFGPPAVGKMTVGGALSRLTGLPLAHNHLSIEAVLPVFGYGEPAFNRLVTTIRKERIAEHLGLPRVAGPAQKTAGDHLGNR